MFDVVCLFFNFSLYLGTGSDFAKKGGATGFLSFIESEGPPSPSGSYGSASSSSPLAEPVQEDTSKNRSMSNRFGLGRASRKLTTTPSQSKINTVPMFDDVDDYDPDINFSDEPPDAQVRKKKKGRDDVDDDDGKEEG